MSDEQKCYAGDLGSDQVGRVVEVTLDDGGRMADELASVKHDRDLEGNKRTWVHFKHIPDRNVLTIFNSNSKAAWLLDPESVVTVRP